MSKNPFSTTILIIIIMLLLTSCAKKEELASNQVKVTPSSLFNESTKSLQPHLDMTTGCVGIEYSGDKKRLGLRYEVWEEGVVTSKKNAVSSVRDGGRDNMTVSFSLKVDPADPKILKYTSVISTESGYSAGTTDIKNICRDMSVWGPDAIEEQVIFSDDEELAIWGVTAHNGETISFYGGEDILSRVKNADKGFIVYLYLEDK